MPDIWVLQKESGGVELAEGGKVKMNHEGGHFEQERTGKGGMPFSLGGQKVSVGGT